MSFQFKKAIREQVHVILTLAGGTGSGKTWSAMALAKGLSGGKRFAVIDTENGRASHYADTFDFDVAELKAPFEPGAYTEAIEAAAKAGYPVIVVDSASHEHAGEGGLLDMHEAELDRLGGTDYAKRDRVKMTAWIKPKSQHKRFVQKLLQVNAHVILCFRAEPKVEIVKRDGKTEVVPKQSLVGLDGWIPISEKNLPFEATASFLLMADHPGVPHPIKLPAMLKPFFPLDKPIDEESGKRVAAWAAGGKAPTAQAMPQTRKPKPPPTKDQVIASFKDIGVGVDALELYVGEDGQRKPQADWTPDDLVSLREFYRDKQNEGQRI